MNSILVGRVHDRTTTRPDVIKSMLARTQMNRVPTNYHGPVDSQGLSAVRDL